MLLGACQFVESFLSKLQSICQSIFLISVLSLFLLFGLYSDDLFCPLSTLKENADFGICRCKAYVANAMLVCHVLLNLQSTPLEDRLVGMTSAAIPTSHGSLCTTKGHHVPPAYSHINRQCIEENLYLYSPLIPLMSSINTHIIAHSAPSVHG